jgi:hypothetical protein
MGILVHGESRTTLAFGSNKRAGYTAALFGLRVSLFERPDDERADGGARRFSTVAEAVVEGFRDIDGGSDGHDMIMAQMTGME